MAYKNLIDWNGIEEGKSFKAGTEYVPVSEKRTAELLTHNNAYGAPIIGWVDEITSEGVEEDVEKTQDTLDDMTKDELMEFLDNNDVEYDSRLKKAELLELAKGV